MGSRSHGIMIHAHSETARMGSSAECLVFISYCISVFLHNHGYAETWVFGFCSVPTFHGYYLIVWRACFYGFGLGGVTRD